ncbi:hypothetical protein QEG73_18615 [Chitinophagaceae bacterium 26-R-25]|nr:hypothetical protein [Chitinophagaceae bacterium 26-R-25]
MTFNFYEEFQNHSNEELITIVRQTNAYQPEAVAAAYQHLNEREVSQNEILGVKEISENNYTIGTNEDRQEDLLVPHIKEPQQGIFPNKWINILLGIIALQFFYRAGDNLYYFYKHSIPLSFLLNYNSLITYVILPTLFLLIFKRYKLAWFIFFVPNLLSALVVIARKATAIAYDYVDNYMSLLSPAIAVAISLAYVVILWKEEVANLFSISKSTKQKTALIVLGLSFLLWVFQPQ